MRPEQGRISVLRKDELVPLFAGPGRAVSRPQPWKGLLLERHTVAPTEIPEHEHLELCLHLQLQGDSGVEWWSEGRNRVEKTTAGSLILLPAGTRDRLRWQGDSERIVVSIAPAMLKALGEEMGTATLSAFRAHWRLRSSGLRHLISDMGREAMEGWPRGGLYADLLAVSLSKQLLSHYAENPVAMRALAGGLTRPKLRLAMDYFHENMGEDLRLAHVAETLGLSPFHFARTFRESTGRTPYQYLLDQRVEHAKMRLRNSAWSVQEIGAQVGFKSDVNFVRAFRQRVGVAPGAWRADVRS